MIRGGVPLRLENNNVLSDDSESAMDVANAAVVQYVKRSRSMESEDDVDGLVSPTSEHTESPFHAMYDPFESYGAADDDRVGGSLRWMRSMEELQKRQQQQLDALQRSVTEMGAQMAAHMEANGQVMERLVAQTVSINNSLGTVVKAIAKGTMPNGLKGLMPLVAPPLTPAFAQPTASPPLCNPPLREMHEWEKTSLATLIRGGRMDRSKYNGIAAILEPKTGQASADIVMSFDVFEYDDYTLWKLWHYLALDKTLEEVLTPGERDDLYRQTRIAQETKPKARGRGKAKGKHERTREEHLLHLAKQTERSVLRIAAKQEEEEKEAKEASEATARAAARSGATSAPPAL